jgi:molybdenum cofactor sulfurtransferase
MAATMDSPIEYDDYISRMREQEYPMLKSSLYLDHAGTTLYSKTLLDKFHASMMNSLYGNPHSASPSSQRSTTSIEAIRLQALAYFNADLELFDLVFTANTTAAIKLVGEAFREQREGFWYGYHADCHTSLVGVRELAEEASCFQGDGEVEAWLDRESGAKEGERLRLFAYPAQSNLNGRRLPLDWNARCRGEASGRKAYTLWDAAAYATTAAVRLDDVENAPDFTVLSFSKMFGFPDLGALIVKKDVAHLFSGRKYFGGGTVDMVVCVKEQWHAVKSGSLHEQLEDGTLPVHSILALGAAMETQTELFRSLDDISRHTAALAKQLYDGLKSLRHANGQPTCEVYQDGKAVYGDATTQGPIVAFNIRSSQSQWVSNAEVEKLASIKDIHLRTGGLCNPGGIAKCLKLEPWEMRENFSAGFRCGSENDILNGKPTGVIRVSLGAMSTPSDVERFVDFVKEFFVEHTLPSSTPPSPLLIEDDRSSRLHVESLTVYPIKSCGGWQVPYGTAWDIRPEGLAWDREWCLVKPGSNTVLSQKAHPRMALIRPHLDFAAGHLRIALSGSMSQITVPLSQDPTYFSLSTDFRSCNATVCGDAIQARVYTSTAITEFFTQAIGVPCTLARFPASSGSSIAPSMRHSKSHLRPTTRQPATAHPRPLLLSNESPILTISRSSLNRLNESIKSRGGKAAHPAVFRANIVLAESPLLPPGRERPWAEDEWSGMKIGSSRDGEQDGVEFDFLGGCRRCQMVCIDQESGEKNQEPFVTLAKTRRFAGRGVLFGVHTCLAEKQVGNGARIKAGDEVVTW